MSLCPFADVRLLPESHTQPSITPRLAILHSAAGKGSLYNFFAKSSNLESHFWVGEDGTIEQYIDTNVRADANLKANGFAVSIETESTVSARERWNPVQAAAIVRLVGWICDEHRIPKRQVPTWDGSGIGWHVQFGAPGPWTPVAKECPGKERAPQARDEIIPAVAAGGPAPHPPKPAPPIGDDLMSAEADKIRAELAAAEKRQTARTDFVFKAAADADKALTKRLELLRDATLLGLAGGKVDVQKLEADFEQLGADVAANKAALDKLTKG